jgi:hypothetical protein
MKRRKKECPLCGRMFTPLAGNQKYCSLQCSRTAQRIRRARWAKENEQYYKEYRSRSKEMK